MKPHILLSLSLIASASLTHAVVIDIDGAVQGSGEFADYSGYSSEAPITPNSSVTESNFTLSTVFSAGSGSGSVNWNQSWPTGLTYTAGQEINFRAGGNGDNDGSATRVIGSNYFDIDLSGNANFDLNSISVELWRNGSGASIYYQFAYDDEGNGTYEAADFLGSSTQVSGNGVTAGTPNQIETIAYSGTALPDDVADATVRLYFWGATSPGGNTHLINVTADYTPIPEPSTYAALVGLLGLGLVIVRRRRS